MGGALRRSGRHRVTDELALEMFGHDDALCRWIRLARERVTFQGLPARIFWLGYGERARFGLRINDLVRAAGIEGADRHRSRPPRHRIGRVAQPRNRGHARRQRRDCRLAGPERAAQHLVRCHVGLRSSWRRRRASATRSTQGWSSWRTGRARPTRSSQRVLTCDPGLGVVRHADAGYPDAIDTARPPRHRHASG